MCIFLAILGIHVVLLCHGMAFSMCDSVFNLALPFLDILDEMGCHTAVEMDCRMDSKVSGMDL